MVWPTLRPPLLLCAALLMGAGCGGSDVPRERRVLLVGWDGATFDLIDPMVAAGQLPHLAALMEEGRTAQLESTRIPISSAAWPTISTGRTPGEHGVYSFFKPLPNSYDARLISARDVDAVPLWRMLSARGRGVHVWGVPITFPPEPVDGTMVAGMLSPFDGDYAWPEGTADRLREGGFVPDLGLWRQDQVVDTRVLEEQLAIKERELLALASRNDWSMAMFVFKSLDVLCHRPNLRLDGPEIRWLLVRLDEILGRLVEAAGDDAVVIVLSDHGFTRYESLFNLRRWLIDQGHSVLRESASVEASPTGPLAERKGEERSARLNELDLDRTVAWCGACEGPFGSIRLNVVGREPRGVIAPEDYDAQVESLRAELEALEFPEGQPAVLRVRRGDQLYPGPHSGLALGAAVPDLIVELRQDVQCVEGGYSRAFSRRAPFPDHALDGICVIAGADVQHSGERGRLQQIDIAPLVLHALREPIPRSMKGTIRENLFRHQTEVLRIDDAADGSLISTEEAFRSRAADGTSSSVVSRISTLGYGPGRQEK